MSTPFDSLPADVQEALLRGRHDEAARRLRQARGISLKAAQARIDAVVGQGLPAARQAPVPRPGGGAKQASPGAEQASPPGLDALALQLVGLLRRVAGHRAGGHRAEHARRATTDASSSSSLAPGEQPRREWGNGIVWVLAALAVAWLLWSRP